MSNRPTALNSRAVKMPWAFSREAFANEQRSKANGKTRRRAKGKVARATRQAARR